MEKIDQVPTGQIQTIDYESGQPPSSWNEFNTVIELDGGVFCGVNYVHEKDDNGKWHSTFGWGTPKDQQTSIDLRRSVGALKEGHELSVTSNQRPDLIPNNLRDAQDQGISTKAYLLAKNK